MTMNATIASSEESWKGMRTSSRMGDPVFLLWSFICLFVITSYLYRKQVAKAIKGFVLRLPSSWVKAWIFLSNSPYIMDEGARQCGSKSRTFKIPTLTRWIVVSFDTNVFKEVKNADENILSMQAAADERNGIGYLISDSVHKDPYHMGVVNKQLITNLANIVPATEEELALSIHRDWPQSADWTTVTDLEGLVSRTITAATNRVLVGIPLCRDKEYLHCVDELTMKISYAGLVCDLSPAFLRPLVATILVRRSQMLVDYVSKLGAVFEQRRKEVEAGVCGTNTTQNDAVQWILEAAPAGTSTHELCMRILYLNFSSIHTMAVSLMHALYDLAEHTQYQQTLRDEIEQVLREYGGWTKLSLSKMCKLDSTMRESQRLHPVTTATMMRRAQKDHVLADGTKVREGEWVVIPAYAINRSPEHHDNAEIFNPFRFVRLTEDDKGNRQHSLGHPDQGYLSFGMGKHACPGRYFAEILLKTMFAHIVLNYDFKILNDAKPRIKFRAFACNPDLDVKLVFSKRTRP